MNQSIPSKHYRHLCILLAAVLTLCVPSKAISQVSAYGDAALRSSVYTYIATSAPTTLASSCTDAFEIAFGGSISEAEILQIDVAYTGAYAATSVQQIFVLKRSTGNTSGSSTTETAVATRSSAPSAGCVVKTYTANATLGSLVGTSGRVAAGLMGCIVEGYDHNRETATPLFKTIYRAPPGTGQGIKLVSSGQTVSVNLNGVTPGFSSPKFVFRIIWTEKL